MAEKVYLTYPTLPYLSTTDLLLMLLSGNINIKHECSGVGIVCQYFNIDQ